MGLLACVMDHDGMPPLKPHCDTDVILSAGISVQAFFTRAQRALTGFWGFIGRILNHILHNFAIFNGRLCTAIGELSAKLCDSEVFQLRLALLPPFARKLSI